MKAAPALQSEVQGEIDAQGVGVLQTRRGKQSGEEPMDIRHVIRLIMLASLVSVVGVADAGKKPRRESS
jgi:hypothetical protein